MTSPAKPRESAAPSGSAARRVEIDVAPQRNRVPSILLAAGGCLLYWAALPPLNLAHLVWAAPVPWIVLALRRAPKRREYIGIWSASFVFWLATLHWLRFPHWATALGGVLLSAYLACYLPVFVALLRVVVDRTQIPVPAAAGVLWTALDVARAYLLTGFSMGALPHALYRQPLWIQTADLIGEQGLGGVIVALAAGSALALRPGESRRRRIVALAATSAGFALLAAYGLARMNSVESADTGPTYHIALIQGSADIVLDPPPGRRLEIHREYMNLTAEAVAHSPQPDLVIWPETVYGNFLYDYGDDLTPPQEWNEPAESFPDRIRGLKRSSLRDLTQFADQAETSLLLGLETVYVDGGRMRFFNSAAFVRRNPDGTATYVGRYDKRHLVLFGEYIPLVKHLPWLQDFSPLSTSTTPGTHARAFELPPPADVDEESPPLRVAPNICYESVLSRVIRDQLAELRGKNRDPDVLVNLTNDGWFFGSSELDLHLACGVFRAIETRKPFLIAANTGISAALTPSGRIMAEGPRRAPKVIQATVRRNTSHSLYATFGWVESALCVAMAIGIGIFGMVSRHKRNHAP
ncbi:apolipoprotein N-acyltransferase [Thermostilla marina]